MATYEVCVDWNNDGDYGDANEDISADVKSIRIQRGRDDELKRATAGTLELRVKDTNGKYSPENSGGVLYGNLLPRRPVRVRVDHSGWYTLFTGFLERIVPHAHKARQDAYLYAVDGIDYLSRVEVTTALYTDELVGTLIGHILDAAEWPGGDRTLDAGIDKVPFGYWNRVRAMYALGELEESERGFVYVDETGKLVFEDRHHRLLSPHTVSQAIFDDVMADIIYDYGAKDIYNEIRATITPRTLGDTAVLWTLDFVPLLQASESITFWGDFLGLSTSLVTPAATTDYTANTEADGSGEDKTTDIGIAFTGFGYSCKVVVTNNDSAPVYLTLLQVRGKQYTDNATMTQKAEDATSQTAYQKRTHRLDGRYLKTQASAQAYCNWMLQAYKDPRARIALALNQSQLTQILTRKLSDRITVQCTRLGLDADFFINRVMHQIEVGRLHRCEWELEKCSSDVWWILGTSTLGTGTVLAY